MLYFRGIAVESDHSADYQSITHRVPSLPIDLQADVGEDF